MATPSSAAQREHSRSISPALSLSSSTPSLESSPSHSPSSSPVSSPSPLPPPSSVTSDSDSAANYHIVDNTLAPFSFQPFHLFLTLISPSITVSISLGNGTILVDMIRSGKRSRHSSGAVQTSKRNKAGSAAPIPDSTPSSSSTSTPEGDTPAAQSSQSTLTPASITTSTASSSKTPAQKKMQTFNSKWKPEENMLQDILCTRFLCHSFPFIARLTVIADRVAKGWKQEDERSVYKRYKMPPGIEEGEDGVVRYTFGCTR